MVPSYFREKSGVDDARRDYKNNQECDAVIFTGIIDRRYYLTIREGGAESLQDLHETAGLPKYQKILRQPGFFSHLT